MSLEEILDGKEISTRTYNICRYNGLLSIKDILKYYRLHRTFNDLRNCGRKSNEELIALSQNIIKTEQESIKQNNLKDPDSDVYLGDLFAENAISTRSYNVCRINGLTSLKKIENHYLRNGDFKTLRNSGKNTNKELIKFCQKNSSKSVEESLKIENVINELNVNQRKIINSFLKSSIEKLNVRSRNALMRELNQPLNFKNFAYHFLLKNNFEVGRMDKVGKKSIPEIEDYIKSVRDHIFMVHNINDDKKLRELKNELLLRELSSTNVPNDILESQNLFEIVNYLLDNSMIFDHTKTSIFKYAFKIYRHIDVLGKEKIANLVSLSPERIRQKRVNLLTKIDDDFKIIKSIDNNFTESYGIDTTQSFLSINDEVVETINKKSKTKFSKEFISYILYLNLESDYNLLGNKEQVFLKDTPKNNNCHFWNSFYIIQKNIFNQIDLDGLINDVDKKLNDKIEESYSLNVKSYLFRFLKFDNMDIIQETIPVIEHIIMEEFNLYIDIHDNIVFKRNTKKRVYEYAYEALDDLNVPSKVKDIYKKVTELFPDYHTSEDSLRASMNRDNGFVPIGRKSVYGLKKWEEERHDFMGGTIRSIAKKYLKKFDEPKNYKDIVDYVLKYRPKSNQKSIIYNLKLDESGTFRFYDGQRIGLNVKY